MAAVSLKALDIFNMSSGQVFVAGRIEGAPQFIRPSLWKLFVNGREVKDLEAIGEQLPKNSLPNQRVISYKGNIDTAAINLTEDEVVLVKVGELP